MRKYDEYREMTEQALIPALTIVEMWTTHDVRPGREEERWINILARRA